MLYSETRAVKNVKVAVKSKKKIIKKKDNEEKNKY
jgi:hypothetical protein